MKFLEALDELYKLKHKEAVWEEIVSFLSHRVDDDVQEATHHILSDDAGKVPQDVIEEIIKAIRKEKLGPLEQAIDKYIEMEVGNGKEEQQRGKASVTGKKKPTVRRQQGAAAGGGSASDKHPQQGD